MIRRVGIIGDGVATALRSAWQGTASAFLELEFFIAPAADLAQLGARGTELRGPSERVRRALAASSGGDGAVRLDRYRLCLLCGLGVAFPGDLDGRRGLSRAVIERTVVDRTRASAAVRLLATIRRDSEVAVEILPAALPDPEAGAGRTAALSYRRYLELVAGVFRDLRGSVVGQPETTLVDGRFTAPEWAPRVGPGGDRFGRAVLGELLGRLEPDAHGPSSRRQLVVESVRSRARGLVRGEPQR